MQLLPTPTQAVIVATQAIVAAIIEERFVLTADENGFRNRQGDFVSRRRAYGQAVLGVGGIAISVLLIPYVANTFFLNPLVQTAGVALVAGVGLIHQIVARWDLDIEDYLVFTIGVSLFFAPYRVIGGVAIGVILSIGVLIEYYSIRDTFSAEDAKKGVDALKQEPSEVSRIIIVVVFREQSPYEAIDAVKSPQSKARQEDAEQVEE